MKDLIYKIDKKILDLIIFTEKISIFISFIGILGQYLFFKYYIDLNLYYISIEFFKSGLLAGICSLCFGIFFNELKAKKIT